MALDLLLTNTANAVLGGFLVLLGVVVLRSSPDRSARGPLAAFLALVGLNYLMDGVRGMASVDLQRLLSYGALLPVVLDPPMLVAFAFAVTRGPLTRLRVALLAVPALVIAGLFLAYPPGDPHFRSWGFGTLPALEILLYYPLALALLVASYAKETRALQRDRMGALVAVFGLAVLPRVPLLLVDLGFYNANPRLLTASLLIGGLAVGYLVVLVALRALAPPLNGPHVAGTMRTLGLSLASVAAIWAVLPYDPLSSAAFALTYSARWILFAALFAMSLRRYDLLELPEARQTIVRRSLMLAFLGLATLELGVLIRAVEGVSNTAAVLVASILVLVAAAAVRALAPPRAALAERRLSLYRAYVELGAHDAELASLETQLGLTAKEARDVRGLVALERAAPSTLADLEEGKLVLGRYQVERFLGAGSFGRAFLAWDRSASERVVLKELLPRWRADASALARFRKEADVALRVSSPHLVAFHGLERLGDGHLLVLQHVEGETLHARLQRGPLSKSEAATLAQDLLAGLATLHDAGLVHRDVKPENIILKPDGHAVLLDFGAVAAADGGTVALAVGTRGYMSPEQMRGEPASPASDLYAAALVAWEALAGGPPPRALPDPTWAAPLERALAARPEDRWADARAMGRALDAVTARAS